MLSLNNLIPEPVIIASRGENLNLLKICLSCFVDVFKRKGFILTLLFLSSFYCSLTDANASEKIGVLYSYKNVEAYTKNNIVGFEQIWKSFLETFEGTNLDYQFVCNITPETKPTDIDVDILFFPLAVDFDQSEKEFLNLFLHSGGKLIISAGIGEVSEELKNFLHDNGIEVKSNLIARTPLKLKYRDLEDSFFELPIGDFYSDFSLLGSSKKNIAKWRENNNIAIGASPSLLYIGYTWGQESEKNNDIKIFLKAIDFVWKDISFLITKKITSGEYKKIAKEINILKAEAALVIKIAEQLDLAVPRYLLTKHFDDGIDYLNDFNSNYLFANYKSAREDAASAKNEFAFVYSLGIPVRKVEVRAIWLDRGSIVGCKGPTELRNLIKNLSRIGFNVIFFETVNAGFPIYPSKLLPQNPLIKGWDPLAVAVEAAHMYGIELHAWVWTFAVGNTRHNLLINYPTEYPGPILSTKGKNWALATQDGSLRIETQPETWVSPANKEACNFLQELFLEIVNNYDIDGFQFDYVRFPFQKKYSQIGFDPVTRNAFRSVTRSEPALTGSVNKVWREWKATLVSEFVRDTSEKIKNVKPNLKISAAVFAIDRTLRMQLIQQDWETWLINQWIDVVYPFYYSYTKEEIKSKLEHERRLINDKGIIIPAFNLRVLSIGELAERITQSRNAGVLGTAFFANEHLNSLKSSLLRDGPYREKTVFTPYEKPLEACQKLLDEFNTIVEKFALAKKLSILSESKTQKEVYYLTQDLKKEFATFTPEKADDIERKLTELQLKVKDWLGLEKYVDRDQRAMYISSYLDQIRTLLGYVLGK